MHTITPKELHSLLQKSPHTIQLIDVRGTGEYSEIHIPEAINIPLHTIPFELEKLDRKKQLIFICRSGGRSGQATLFAANNWIQAYNLIWGMNDFEKAYPERVVHGEKKKLFWIF